MLSKRRNRNILFRCLLLTGYLFLFAGQVNCRYYNIANFYVYGSNKAVGKVNVDKQHPATALQSSKKPSHLGIDKRFQGVDVFTVSTVFFQSALFSTTIERRYGQFRHFYSSSDPPVLTLRGPPVA
ncbi:MAG TPA: hypothetical protein VL727_08600 [Puia sp.]|nr:hypothetical protein [Puia sp.]